MSTEKWLALEEEGGKVFLVQIVEETIKIKGLGVFNPAELLAEKQVGETVVIGQKILTVLTPRLPELYRGMKRRAQTISAKDAGIFITKLGIGAGDCLLYTSPSPRD